MADAKRIVRIDYKAYFAEADKLYDTTNADAAKEAGIFNEKVTYAPMAYVVGSNSLYADVDAAIKKTYKDIAKKYNFQGFRRGHAPPPAHDCAPASARRLAERHRVAFCLYITKQRRDDRLSSRLCTFT